jgi:hypothetical protein
VEETCSKSFPRAMFGKAECSKIYPTEATHQPNVKWHESTVKPSRNAARCTKSNTAAPEERRTEPRTGAGEHTELNLLARSQLREQIWMREQACSMASMVAWSCCGSGLPPGKLCMAAAAAPDRA